MSFEIKDRGGDSGTRYGLGASSERGMLYVDPYDSIACAPPGGPHQDQNSYQRLPKPSNPCMREGPELSNGYRHDWRKSTNKQDGKVYEVRSDADC